MLKIDDHLLTISNLSARIGRQDILTDISLDIRRGECVALVGGSGAGKSSLLRCLIGLYKPAEPYQGVMRFGDQQHDFAIGRNKRPDQSGFAFVPQNPQAGLDPLKRLAFQWKQAWRCARAVDRQDQGQLNLLDSLELSSLGRSYPHQWSQGMQQRLLIAFALLSHPRLLVLDEPTSALDPLIAAKTITRIVKHASERDIAILIVTHDLALATRFADRVAVMYNGRIEEFGPTDAILQQPNSDYGKLLVANTYWGSQNLAHTGTCHAFS